MCETVDDVFVVVIARAGIPGHHLFGVGTHLHHSLWHRGSGERAAAQGACGIGLRADKRIDILGVIGCGGLEQQCAPQG